MFGLGEDEDSKTRRNVMITATVILGGWLVGLHPLQLLHDILKLDSLKIDEWRAWALAFFFHIYFWARYHFTPPTRKKSGIDDEGDEYTYDAPITFRDLYRNFRLSENLSG